MPTLPSATATVTETAQANAAGLDLLAVIMPCATSDDAVPRLFGNSAAIEAQHGFCDGSSFCASYMQETRKPLLVVGVPIVTAGTVGRFDASGNTDTCVVTAAAGADGCLVEHDGVLTVITGGTIGTDQIVLGLSLDGGRNTKRVRLGTASSYTIPRIGVVLSFAAGDLTADETVLTWHGTAPRMDSTGLTDAREGIAATSHQPRTILVIGDHQNNASADTVVTEAAAYETTNGRRALWRASVLDRLPLATLSQTQVRMTGSPTLTFAEVGGTGDTITRSAGSWIEDGFAVNDLITVTGAVNGANNETAARIASLSATVITLDADDLVDEAATAGCTVVASPRLVFAEVGGTGDTITRSRGSWLDDGFRVGDVLTIAGTVSNNATHAAGITGVTATVITLDTDDLTAETIAAYGVTITAGQTKAVWAADIDAEFADIDDKPMVNFSAGRAFKECPVLRFELRRPLNWLAAIREMQHDIHIPTMRVSDGALLGASLEDSDGSTVEWDERTDGALLAGRFTCARTFANGPAGVYIALDLTRGTEGAMLSRAHTVHVANLCHRTAVAAGTRLIGQVLTLKTDGTGEATEESLVTLESAIDSDLEQTLLRNAKGEGARASGASVTFARDTDLSEPGATLPGVIDLIVNGVVEQIDFTIRVS